MKILRFARVMAATAVGLALATPAVASSAGAVVVTGYIEQGSSPSLIDQSIRSLSTVGVDGVNLTSTANAVTPLDASALALLHRAHSDHLRAELLIGNYDDSIGDFSPRIAAKLLHSAVKIRVVATLLAQLVIKDGWDGLTVDLESLDPSDRAGLTRFVIALRADLPTNRSLSIDVSASTTPSGYNADGYDLTSLSRVVDRVVVMTYDQHGPWSGPGPIGSLDWQQRAVAALLTRVSATKVDLGIAGYGYTWPPGAALHHGISLSDRQARAMVANDGATARWVPAAGEWTATLKDGTVLWWSDLRSYRLRTALAARLHLHGVALWQLATSDRLS